MRLHPLKLHRLVNKQNSFLYTNNLSFLQDNIDMDDFYDDDDCYDMEDDEEDEDNNKMSTANRELESLKS